MLAIYVIYGLSFLILAVALAFQYFSSIRILPKLPILLLMSYAILHSYIEFQELFQALQIAGLSEVSTTLTNYITNVLLPVCFMLLFAFGMELLIGYKAMRSRYRLVYAILPVAVGLLAIIPSSAIAPINYGWPYRLELLTHYFIALPSGLISGYALWLAADCLAARGRERLVRSLKISAAIFFIYGVAVCLLMMGAAPVANHPEHGMSVTATVIAIRAAIALGLAISLSYAFIVELARFDLTSRKMREEFASLMAHDIRSILGTISMSSELLSRPDVLSRLDDFSRRLVTGIRSNVKLALSLISQMFDLTLIELHKFALNLKDENVGAVISNVSQQLLPMLGQRVLSVRLPAVNIVAPIDKERVEQVMVNLLSNAGKYSYPECHVVVELAEVDGFAKVTVASEGPVIPKSDLDQLFAKYYRRHTEQQKGTGLGLFIVREFIEAHGGHVFVHSDEIGRTTFGFTIPLAAPVDRRVGRIASAEVNSAPPM